MYGPKGVGVLYVRRGTNISPIFLGGGQEFGLRSTTENLALIAGFSHAFKIAHDLRDKESKRLVALRDYFITKLLALDEKRIFLNGDPKKRLPNNVNASILGIDPEFTVLKLDAVGIYCSTKSSCLKDEKESYVVKSATGNSERASTTLRFTMGRETSKKDLDFVISHLKKVI
jgi:cysteine desulfurase